MSCEDCNHNTATVMIGCSFKIMCYLDQDYHRRDDTCCNDTSICQYCKKKMIPHIIEEGSRRHTSIWDGNGRRCSEKDCEDNHGWGKCVNRK